MTEMDPNHPSLITGRRHGRELIEAGARVVRVAAGSKKADAVSSLSTAQQLIISAALVDGYQPHECYEAASAFLAWLVMRLPKDKRLGVLTAMTSEIVNRIQLAEAGEDVEAKGLVN